MGRSYQSEITGGPAAMVGADPVSHKCVVGAGSRLLGLPVLGYRAPPMTRRFQVGDAPLCADDPQLGPALADAHARRIRPLCLCREPGAPMYVARVRGV